MEDAIRDFSAALELDPRSGGLAMDIANTFAWLGRHDEADRYFRRGIDITPRAGSIYSWRAWNRLLRDADLASARAMLAVAEQTADLSDWRQRVVSWYQLELIAGDPAAALEHVTAGEDDWIELQYSASPRSLLVGEARWRMGDRDRAGQDLEAARRLLEAELAARPDDAFLHRDLALVLARVGDRSEAVRMGLRGVELMSPSADALIAPDFVRDLASVYVMVGDPEAAVETLERLMARPGRAISVPLLRVDPTWDLLREEARFERILDG